MTSQESVMMIKAMVEKAMELIKESTTFEEQLRCFVYFYVLIPRCTLPVAFLIWFFYFLLSLVTTYFRDELDDISPADWKERKTLSKCRDVLKQQALRLLEQLELAATHAKKDAATQVDDEQLGVEDSVEETQSDFGMNCEECAVKDKLIKKQIENWNDVIHQLNEDVEFLEDEVYNLEDKLDESQCFETELNERKAECKKLNDSLLSKQDMEESVHQFIANSQFVINEAVNAQCILKDENNRLLKYISQMIIDGNKQSEQHALIVSTLNDTINGMEIQIHDLIFQSSEYEVQSKFEIAELDETIRVLEDEIWLLQHGISIDAANVSCLQTHLLMYQEQHKELEEIIHELETGKEELVERLSVEAENADHFRALSSEYKEQHEVEEAKLKQTIEELKAENNYLHESVSVVTDRFVYFTYSSSESLQQEKVEKDKLNVTISELKHEKNELTAELNKAYSTIEQFRAISSEYKEANESLEQEKDMLLMNLQKANESAELHKKLLELDYAIL